jgi:hypothetical protein
MKAAEGVRIANSSAQASVYLYLYMTSLAFCMAPWQIKDL